MTTGRKNHEKHTQPSGTDYMMPVTHPTHNPHHKMHHENKMPEIWNWNWTWNWKDSTENRMRSKKSAQKLKELLKRNSPNLDGDPINKDLYDSAEIKELLPILITGLLHIKNESHKFHNLNRNTHRHHVGSKLSRIINNNNNNVNSIFQKLRKPNGLEEILDDDTQQSDFEAYKKRGDEFSELGNAYDTNNRTIWDWQWVWKW